MEVLKAARLGVSAVFRRCCCVGCAVLVGVQGFAALGDGGGRHEEYAIEVVIFLPRCASIYVVSGKPSFISYVLLLDGLVSGEDACPREQIRYDRAAQKSLARSHVDTSPERQRPFNVRYLLQVGRS